MMRAVDQCQMGRTPLLSAGVVQSGASTFSASVDPNNPNKFTFRFNWTRRHSARGVILRAGFVEGQRST